MGTLLLMRHAKSDWSAGVTADHDRPLNARGAAAAEAMGRVLADQCLVPNLVICSSAVRARTTAETAARSGGWQCEIVTDPRLYGAGVRDVLRVGATAAPVDSLMLVGHQPTWSMIVSQLTGRDADMKTATVAVVDLDIDEWSELPNAQGTLRRVIQPRNHTSG